MITLAQAQLKIVKDILFRHLDKTKVCVFGSRATATPKPFSDLDLVVMGDQPIDSRLLYKIMDDFEESDLPIHVDIVDWHCIDDNFRQIIQRNCVELK